MNSRERYPNCKKEYCTCSGGGEYTSCLNYISDKQINENKTLEIMKLTKGQSIAAQIRPFIMMPPTPSDTDEVLKGVAKTIDDAIEEQTVRVKQLLSCLDYGEMTEYQIKVIELLELSFKKQS